MSGKKKGSVIGFDPLAWMKDGGTESGIWREGPTAKADPETGMPAPHTEHRSPDSPDTIALGEVLTIEQAVAMSAELGRHLGTPSVTLVAGALQRIDAAGLQLLTAFVQTADRRGTRVAWQAPTAVLREAARRTGLTAALRLA